MKIKKANSSILFIFNFFLFILFSCGNNPNGPETRPVISTIGDTTISIYDTLPISIIATCIQDIIYEYKWDIDSNGVWDGRSYQDSAIFTYTAPDTACTVAIVIQAQNGRGEVSSKTIHIIVLTDSIVLSKKNYFNTVDSLASSFEVFFYNAAGQNVKTVNYTADTAITGSTVVAYTTGNKTTQTMYDTTGTVVSSAAYLYDAQNNNSIILYLDASSIVLGSDTLVYDAYDNNTRISHYGSDAALWYWYELTYDTQNRVTKKTYFSKTGVQGGYTVYEYNLKGRTSKESRYNKSDVILGWFEYKYDSLHRRRE